MIRQNQFVRHLRPLPDLQPEAENDSPSDAQADEPPDLEAQGRFALHIIIIIKCI